MSLTPTVLQAYDRSAPDTDQTETVTFGVGCFWGPDAEFGGIDGVVRTRVGYAGGTKPDPTYHSLGDHTEVVQIEYDPDACSDTEMLERIFTSHNPHRQTGKRQYHNVLLTESEAQTETVWEYLESSPFDPDSVETRIETLSRFYVAENYHQKYNLRSKRWAKNAFDDAGYDADQLRDSPAAAKLNAHVSGHDVDLPFLDARRR